MESLNTASTLTNIDLNDEQPSDAKRQKLDDPVISEDTIREAQKPEQKANKKRKYALCIGYSGQGYFGLQR